MNRRVTHCGLIIALLLGSLLSPLGTVERVAAALPTWATVAGLPTPRASLGVTAAPDGTLYAIGGANSSGFLATAERYDPTANSWVARQPMPTPRTTLGVATGSDGNLYAVGGANLTGVLATVERYNPSTNTWSTAASMPTARAGLGLAAAADGKLYAIGGAGARGYLATVEAYDPVANAWSSRAPMPTARAGLAVAAAGNGKLYAIGGLNAKGFLSTVDVYDPVVDTWTSGTPLPTARAGLAAVAAGNGELYAIGGANLSGFLSTVEEEDPTTGTWTVRTSMLTARATLGAATAQNGGFFAIGGANTTGLLGTVEQGSVPTSTIAPGPSRRPNATLTPTATWTPIKGNTATPTQTFTATPTSTNTPVGTNPCLGIYSPGLWKNYQNHFPDAQFYALLTQTVDFGPTFAARSQTDAINLAETILQLQGNYNVRSELTAELNVAFTPTLGIDTYIPAGTTQSINSLLTQAYLDNGAGNSSPFTNGNLTSTDLSVLAYLSGGGEDTPPQGCQVGPPATTATPTNTATATTTASNTATNTPSNTATNTPTVTNTPTNTATPTDTPTNTPTVTDTPTGTATATPTASPTVTFTPSSTATPTPTDTATDTPTPTPAPTDTPTDTATSTPTDTATATPTPTDTPTSTPTPTPVPTDTASPTDTPTPTPVPTDTPTATPTPTDTSTPSPTPTDTATATDTPTETATPPDTATSTPTDTPTPVPTDTATATATDTPTATPSLTDTPTDTATSTATSTATATPTNTSTATPSATSTATATATSTITSTATSTLTATATPTSTPTLVLPPDPSTVAPPLNSSTTTNLLNATSFLYTGSNPIQTGVAPGAIVFPQAAVIRGTVQTSTGSALPGVTISILNHPELGQTLSRADGAFDLAVNGGGQLTVTYTLAGYLPAQRQVQVPWQDYVAVDPVVLIPPDSAVTAIDLTSSAPIQVARGSVVTDTAGTRQATIFVPQGTTATMTLPGGTIQPLTTLHVRASEFTVGASGPSAMPAELPPTSDYTYAVGLTADEALAVGATQVTFSQPVSFYLENFIGFPVGMAVPEGYYDDTAGQWVPSPNGVVVKVLGISSGMASLDVTGSGSAASASQLAALGITNAELTQLAALYSVGQSLWRVPIGHFSDWDSNLPGIPNCAEGTSCKPSPPPPCSGSCPLLDAQCHASGSDIGCERQTLGEALPVAGTGFTLHYDSERQAGNVAARTISIPLSGPTVPPELQEIDLRINVAGQYFTEQFPAGTNQSTTFTWNGRDAYGRPLPGAQLITVQIGYGYQTVYYPPAALLQSFAAYSGAGGAVGVGRFISIVWSPPWHGVIGAGAWDDRSRGLGGWSLNVQQVYDPAAKMLYLGDGERRSAQALLFDVITTTAGTGSQGYSGDNGPATQAQLGSPPGVAVGPDGSVYIADNNNYRIRKISPAGVITTVAGTGQAGYSGDGGPATQAQLFAPNGVAVAPDGSLYIADTVNHRVRRVGPDGIISTVAGNGSAGYGGDGGPATQAMLGPERVAISPDGSLYIADSGNNRIRRVGLDGIITTIAGTGLPGPTGDGGPAAQARLNNPEGMAFAPDGTLYFADRASNAVRIVTPGGLINTVAGRPGFGGFSGDGGLATVAQLNDPYDVALGADGSLFIADTFNARIRQVSPSGVITTIAGTGTFGYAGDNGPGTQAKLGFPEGLGVAPDGTLDVADAASSVIRRLSAAFPGVSVGQMSIPSADGSVLYVFDSGGRHLQTLNALTGAALYQLAYDPAGHLSTITDGDGNVTTIQHDASGNPTAIIAPFGQESTFTVDGNGYLATVTDPVLNVVQLTSSAQGLLGTMTDARGGVHRFVFDPLGRLTSDQEPDGSAKTLTRTNLTSGYQVAVTTSLGRTTTYAVTQTSAGAIQQTVTYADGTKAVGVTGPDGSTTLTSPDGTTTSVVLGADPRFGILAPLALSQTITTPGGLKSTTTVSRAVTLSDPTNPFSLTQQTDKVAVNGRTYTLVYTASSRTFASTSPAGRTASAATDAQGRIVQAQDGTLQPYSLTRDTHGRIATLTQGSGPSARTTSFAYDAAGHLTSITDPLQEVESFTYDADGRPLQEILPDAQVVALRYDANGNVTAQTPPGQPAHAFAYTSLDQLGSSTPPDVGIGTTATTYAYNLDHQLTGVVRPDGLQLKYAYDAAGRLSTITIPTGQLSFGYAAGSGKLSSIVAPSGASLAFAYDGPFPTALTASGAVAGSVTASYDNNFRVTSQTLNGNALSVQYDNDGLVSQVGGLAMQRDPSTGLLTGTSLGTTSDTTGYNGFAEPASYSATAGSSAIYNAQYTYDSLGRIAQKTETIGGVTDTYAYSYDRRGRLVQVQKDGTTTSTYTYGANGNRLSFTGPGGTVNGTYDAQDRMTSYGATTYGYSARGELMSATTAGQTTTYQYDVLGNLLGVNLPNGTQIAYTADGMDRRVAKKVNGTVTQAFLYGGALGPIAQLDASNNVVARFVYATRIDVPDYVIKNGTTYRIISDERGSPRLVVDTTSGAVLEQLAYDEFGNVTQDTNPGFQPFGFAGGLYDNDTKLLRFGARDYDPSTGRWTSQDPIGFGAGDSNLYGYTRGDPVNYTDPTGLIVSREQGRAIMGSYGMFGVISVPGVLIADVTAETAAVGATSGVSTTVGEAAAEFYVNAMEAVVELAVNAAAREAAVETSVAEELVCRADTIVEDVGLADTLPGTEATLAEGTGTLPGVGAQVFSAAESNPYWWANGAEEWWIRTLNATAPFRETLTDAANQGIRNALADFAEMLFGEEIGGLPPGVPD